MGADTLLLTHKIDSIGEMSCNPSFGGIGKGHLMREVDALDGLCGRICDKSGIQYKMLNRRKGPAVWGPRAQVDRKLYKKHVQAELLNMPNLTMRAAAVEDLLLDGATVQTRTDMCKERCHGVVLGDGTTVRAKTVVLTAGTFLRGEIFIGLNTTPAGRIGDQPSVGLARTIETAGFTMGRLKTGTPPRLIKETIDFSKTAVMEGDNPPVPFSFLSDKVWIKAEDQVPCHMTFTNEEVHKVIRDTLHLNKHVEEESSGPMYCPSIESKVLRFKSKTEHQVWLEPEGLDSPLVYPQGISMTMPEEHQLRAMREMRGLERVEMAQPGYGVQYDYIEPQQLRPSLETLRIENLFFAGQINGTTGYEEAAAQGLIAGINAVKKSQQQPPLLVDRTEGYIGVLIDDLTTLGTSEPYRMFTSRAEFRLVLRPDNADLRLTGKGYKAGCVSEARHSKMKRIQEKLEEATACLKSINKPLSHWWSGLRLQRSQTNHNPKSAYDMLGLAVVTMEMMAQAFPDEFSRLPLDHHVSERIKIQATYAEKEAEMMRDIVEARKDEHLLLPDDMDYSAPSLSLSNEAKKKLEAVRPHTIGAASRIQGVTPVAVVRLLQFVKRSQKETTVSTSSLSS
ncbi:PREDICTED: protein MTO1 homolog, mitochondrial-like [Priapulus caudatus]|uniref:Protein MTO1 homolog, mitochondrial-like n=1 Tax=Priapulus caudatus TaxID=37621 RepID=A0ABM1EIQ4_PRICU|nr:PREDICTED: protein MTO1 homolog, mitochondrial-like [Priapulus caudatus]